MVLRRCWVWIRRILIFFFVSTILSVLVLKFVPVWVTPLMFIRLIEQKHDSKPLMLHHQWVSLDRIAQPLVQAVVTSEDNLFLEHHGFDVHQIIIAQEDALKGKRVRGASTITQQTAKNVFLWPGRSYLRKGLEAYFTVLIEWIWGKKRIMEVYLNSIEMGDGIYGAQSVAKLHFNKDAKDLTKRESALIAATLPNPRRFNSANPSSYIRHRQAKILSLMSKLLKVEMGYDNGKNNYNSGKSRYRSKWRANLILKTSGGSTMLRR